LSNLAEYRPDSQNYNAGAYKQGLDVLLLFEVFKKRFWFIALVTILMVAASALFSYFTQQPVYVAQAVLRITQVVKTTQNTNTSTIDSYLSSISSLPVLTMNTHLGQIKSEALMQRVIDKLDLEQLGYTPSTLAAQIQVTATEDSYLIYVSVHNSDPVLAAQIANTLTQEYIAFISEKNKEIMDSSVKALQEELKQARAELAATKDAYERQRLQDVIDLLVKGITQTQIAQSVDLGSTSVVIISPAVAPTQPMASDTNRNIMIAFMIGLAGSAILVIIKEFYSSKIQRPEEINQYLDLPVLGVIAHANRKNLR